MRTEDESLDVRIARLEERDKADSIWRQSVDVTLRAVADGVAAINVRLAAGEGVHRGHSDVLHWAVTGLLAVFQLAGLLRVFR